MWQVSSRSRTSCSNASERCNLRASWWPCSSSRSASRNSPVAASTCAFVCRSAARTSASSSAPLAIAFGGPMATPTPWSRASSSARCNASCAAPSCRSWASRSSNISSRVHARSRAAASARSSCRQQAASPRVAASSIRVATCASPRSNAFSGSHASSGAPLGVPTLARVPVLPRGRARELCASIMALSLLPLLSSLPPSLRTACSCCNLGKVVLCESNGSAAITCGSWPPGCGSSILAHPRRVFRMPP
mmetsp:Transcript_1253/g.3402  ORF Transcript_1253/g.3402 Transcript_1253/m.3402 type:complete len:249 (+) Transcript_1253:340-1086(+)